MLIKDLPEAIKLLAIKRFKEQRSKYTNLEYAEVTDFIWCKTPEGGYFWNEVNGGNFTAFDRAISSVDSIKTVLGMDTKEKLENFIGELKALSPKEQMQQEVHAEVTLKLTLSADARWSKQQLEDKLKTIISSQWKLSENNNWDITLATPPEILNLKEEAEIYGNS